MNKRQKPYRYRIDIAEPDDRNKYQHWTSFVKHQTKNWCEGYYQCHISYHPSRPIRIVEEITEKDSDFVKNLNIIKEHPGNSKVSLN